MGVVEEHRIERNRLNRSKRPLKKKKTPIRTDSKECGDWGQVEERISIEERCPSAQGRKRRKIRYLQLPQAARLQAQGSDILHSSRLLQPPHPRRFLISRWYRLRRKKEVKRTLRLLFLRMKNLLWSSLLESLRPSSLILRSVCTTQDRIVWIHASQDLRCRLGRRDLKLLRTL